MYYFKLLDDLTQGVESILAKSRSSLSVDDVAQLEKMLKTLKELKEVKSSSDRKKKTTNFLLNFIKVFARFKIVKELNDLLEELLNF